MLGDGGRPLLLLIAPVGFGLEDVCGDDDAVGVEVDVGLNGLKVNVVLTR